MLVLTCPVCAATGEETDFHFGGQAHIARLATANPEAIIGDEQQASYLFSRINAKGLHFERVRCDRGCGKWFNAARDTTTMEFKAFYGAAELPPPDAMKQAKGAWADFFATRMKKQK